MPITVSGTSITFNDATVQTTAAVGGFGGATTNAVSSSPITLTSASSQYQVAQISSYTNSYVNLPNATTMSSAGSNPFVIENRSLFGANLELRNTAGTVVGYIPAGQIGLVQLKDKSTSAGQWVVETASPQTFLAYDSSSITSVTNTPTFSGGSGGIVGLTSTTFVRWWTVFAPQTVTMYTQVGTISGSTITFGSIQSTAIASGLGSINYGHRIQTTRLSNTAYALIFRSYGTSPGGCSPDLFVGQSRIAVHTVSGTVVTFGTASSASMPQYSVAPGGSFLNQVSGTFYNGIICRVSDTVFALFYNSAQTNTYAGPYNLSGSLSCQIVSVSGTTLTIGTAVALGTSTYSQAISAVALSATSVFLSYAQATAAGGSAGRSKMVIVSVSGTTPTFNTPVTIEAADVTCFGDATFDGAISPSATQAIFNIGYGVAEASVSGTVPTYDSTPYSNTQLYPMFLCTSSKALATGNGGGGTGASLYLNIGTGGFFVQSPTQVLQNNLSVTNAPPATMLGAQPTTAFVGYKFGTGPAFSGIATSALILGSTT